MALTLRITAEEVPRVDLRVHNHLNQVLGHLAIVSSQLLSVLRKAIASITKTRIVVVGANSGIQTNALDDLLRIQPSCLRVSV